MSEMLPVVAEVTRSGFVEGHHHGSVVVLAPDGSALLSVGRPDLPVLPRSANKPLQVVGMMRAGLDGDDELLAVAASSHSGADRHLAQVRRLLVTAGLSPDLLANTPGLPLDETALRTVLAAGGQPDRLHQNCSGKHAAMLVTAARSGWPTEGYLAPDHPVQQAIRAAVEDLAGERVAHTAVDGCGAPLFALTLTGLARAFARLTTAAPGTPECRVADAMRAHPDLVGGSGRDVTALMRSVPGLLAKDGAEGVYAAALPDGTAVALKIDDGAGRARSPVLVAALRASGVAVEVPDDLAAGPVLGHGRQVGVVRAVLPTA